MSFATVNPLVAFAALVYLAIGLVAVRRAGDVPLARPLAFFALGLFAYVFFEQGTPPPSEGPADAVENAIASLIFIPAVELLLAFAGRRRPYRWVRIAALVFYVPLALYCFLPFFEQGHWELAMLAGLIFFFGVPGWVLVAHYRHSGAVERGRTLLLLGGLLLGGVGAASTLLAAYGAPRLLDIGMVAAGLLLAALVFDRKLLRRSSQLSALIAAVFAALVVAGEVVLFSIREQTGGLFVAGTFTLVLIAFAAVRPAFAAAARERGRIQHLATLGRLAEQMQHDILNPLSVISGNIQLLKEELRLGHSIDTAEESLDSMLAASNRVAQMVRDYRRLSRVDPRPARVRLSSILLGIVEAQRMGLEGVRLAAILPEHLVRCELMADPDLLVTALENLIRNAHQAITEKRTGSTIQVAMAKRGSQIAVSVEDDGPGMDARMVEQACDHYFTTRDTGTGLGLSYAGRVAQAHGGELTIDSTEGKGTVITMHLPLTNRTICSTDTLRSNHD